jgi:hypothetical protein
MSNTYPWPSSGNIGIGLTSPSQSLEVVGNIRADGIFMAYGTGQLELQFWNGGDPVDQRFTELIAQGGAFTGRFVNDTYSAANNWLYVVRASGSYGTQYVSFPSGNVGIGTYTPSAKFHVVGSTLFDGGQSAKVTSINSNTVLDSSYYTVIADTAPSPPGSPITITVTLPSAASFAGGTYRIKNKARGTVAIVGTIDGRSDWLNLYMNDAVTLVSDNTAWYIF